MTSDLSKTPLHLAHLELKGRMVEYAGWDMPVLYTSILDETRAVRQNVGLFDISHMGRIRVLGEGATDYLQSLTSNDVASLESGSAHYSLLTNPNGGIIDDIIVYREAAEAYLVVINAGNTAKDLAWLRSHLPTGVVIEDNTASTAMIAVQGQNAPKLVAEFAEMPSLLDLGRFEFARGVGDWSGTTFCRTGYTGEDGFELIVPAAMALNVWKGLVDKGGIPCGLGARDTLRVEAGYPLYGHEIDDTVSPVEAGLMWVVALDKGVFTGRDAILSKKQAPSKRKLVGLLTKERTQPRQGYPIFAGDKTVGVITSGAFSPIRNHCVAMGFVEAKYAKNGTELQIGVRDRRVQSMVVPKKNLLTEPF